MAETVANEQTDVSRGVVMVRMLWKYLGLVYNTLAKPVLWPSGELRLPSPLCYGSRVARDC